MKTHRIVAFLSAFFMMLSVLFTSAVFSVTATDNSTLVYEIIDDEVIIIGYENSLPRHLYR